MMYALGFLSGFIVAVVVMVALAAWVPVDDDEVIIKRPWNER